MEPLPLEDRNKFVVAAGTHEDIGDIENGPKLGTCYKYVEYFTCLHDAIQRGLPRAKGNQIIELVYIDLDGHVWELDVIKQTN